MHTLFWISNVLHIKITKLIKLEMCYMWTRAIRKTNVDFYSILMYFPCSISFASIESITCYLIECTCSKKYRRFHLTNTFRWSKWLKQGCVSFHFKMIWLNACLKLTQKMTCLVQIDKLIQPSKYSAYKVLLFSHSALRTSERCFFKLPIPS